eukprot:1184593-Prorocentrum_minimum.AAC.3
MQFWLLTLPVATEWSWVQGASPKLTSHVQQEKTNTQVRFVHAVRVGNKGCRTSPMRRPPPRGRPRGVVLLLHSHRPGPLALSGLYRVSVWISLWILNTPKSRGVQILVSSPRPGYARRAAGIFPWSARV